MSAVFLKVLNMSIDAGWLIGAVLVLRLILCRAPKWVLCLLWAIAAVRLVCPFSIESVLSLIPSAETFPEQVISGPSFDIQTGIEPIDIQVNDYLGDRYFEGVTVPTNNGSNVMGVLSLVWLLGMVFLGGYAVISYLRLLRGLSTAVRLRDNVFQSEYVTSPFVMGFFSPRIYLPFGMDAAEAAHVIAHERAHIARWDHWWKPLGFAVLTLHWFNPLVWVAYTLFCRDIELACDERVIRDLSSDQRADYTEALVKCSLSRSPIAACPLAFGEVGVKERVRSVLNYRKPALWIVAAAVALCILSAVCFLTDPVPNREFAMQGDGVSALYPQGIVEHILSIEDTSNVYMNSDNFDLHLNADFTWADSQAIRYFFYQDDAVHSAQLRIFPDEDKFFVTESTEWVEQDSVYTLLNYLDALKYLPQAEIQALCPDADQYILHHVEEGTPASYDRVITYSMDGAGEIDGWYIHLQLQPLHEDHGAYRGAGEEVIDLFYGEAAGSHPSFEAEILEIHDGWFLVEPLEGSWERTSAERIEVPMENMFPSPALAVGDRIRIEYDGQLLETYPARVHTVYEIRVVQQTIAIDLRPMLMADGALYLDTGHAVPAEIDPSAILGQISSTVSPSETPGVDGQSNFGCVGSDYARFEEGIVVLINGEWYFFEPLLLDG